jgi:hypothetical protein
MLTPSRVIPEGPAIALLAQLKTRLKLKRLDKSTTKQIRSAGHTFLRLRSK